MKKYIITICIVIALIVICIIGYFVYKTTSMETTPERIKAKTDEEIKNLDSQIISILNKFNHISYANYKIVETTIPSSNTQQGGEAKSSSEPQGGESSSQSGSQSSNNGESGSQNEIIKSTNVIPNSILTNKNTNVDWDQLKEEIELMYTTWPTVLIDLTSLNINGSDLVKYTNTLDKVVKALEDENKKEAMIQLSNLYNLLNTYVKGYSNNNTSIHTFQTRSYIVKAYVLTEEEKWDEIKQNITQAKNEYTNIVNNIQNTNNTSSINKTYILLNELEKNANEKNKDIFYINYKNVMQELETTI